MATADMDACHHVFTQRAAVCTGLNQSPSARSCLLDTCQLLLHPFFPIINTLIHLESGAKLADEFRHLHSFAGEQIHSPGPRIRQQVEPENSGLTARGVEKFD